jgi:hypothetical protein
MERFRYSREIETSGRLPKLRVSILYLALPRPYLLARVFSERLRLGSGSFDEDGNFHA